MLLILAIGLVLAWKVAGFIGLDNILLPLSARRWRGGEGTQTGRPRIITPQRRHGDVKPKPAQT